MIAAYLRVSTRKDQSTDLQRNDINKYLEYHGHALNNVTFYNEVGVSGTKAIRPELTQLMNAVTAGQIDTVIVWKLDRLFRSFRDLLNTLHFFEERKVKFISVKDNLDLSTPSGRLLMQILGSFAEFEVGLIRERVKAGLRNAREHGTKSGKPIGRPLETDVDKVIALRNTHSYSEIAKKLNITKSAVQRALGRGNEKKAVKLVAK